MNILLMNPIIREWALPNVVPTGLLYLSAVLRRGGHQVDILDWTGHRYSKSTIEEFIEKNGRKYDLIGTGGHITVYKQAKWFAEIVKKYCPDTLTIVGGPLATSIPKLLLENTKFDIVNIGEGEITLAELINRLDNLESVRGIGYKNELGEVILNPPREIINDLDSLPFPDYDNLDTIDIYLRNPIGYLNKRKWIDGQPTNEMKSLNIVTARSCPYSCNFCYSKYLGNRYRARSVKNVVKEMKYLVEKYECDYIHFTDELSFTKKRIIELCDELDNQRVDVMWGGPVRIDLVDKESLERMRESGCKFLSFGIESLSPKILKAMNKKLDPETAKKNLILVKKYFDYIETSFIIGYPGETKETIQESINGCHSIQHAPSVIFFATPYPETPLYNFALKNGYIKDEIKYIESLDEQGQFPIINFTDMSTEELMSEKERWLREVRAYS